jgi:hypothetical protein
MAGGRSRAWISDWPPTLDTAFTAFNDSAIPSIQLRTRPLNRIHPLDPSHSSSTHRPQFTDLTTPPMQAGNTGPLPQSEEQAIRTLRKVYRSGTATLIMRSCCQPIQQIRRLTRGLKARDEIISHLETVCRSSCIQSPCQSQVSC